MKTVNWNDNGQSDAEFFAQFGYSIEGLTKPQLDALSNAVECAALEIDRGSDADEYELTAAYIGGCFDNNFNL